MPIIYLRSTVNEEDGDHSLLVHEAAHGLHFLKDFYGNSRFSERWYSLFPNERKGREVNDPNFLEESRVLNSYAAKNYHTDDSEELNFPKGKHKASFTYSNGLRIELFGRWKYKDAADHLFQQSLQMPGKLPLAASHIVVVPNLSLYGFCYSNIRMIAPTYSVVTEDIATHTSFFHSALWKPEKYP